jgi:hypothetical protein
MVKTIECSTCPAKLVDVTHEDAEETHAWTFSRTAAEWVCACCYTEFEQQIAAEYGYMAEHVRQSRVMRRLGDDVAADAIAYAVAGVRSC